jgi:hypothetical protein
LAARSAYKHAKLVKTPNREREASNMAFSFGIWLIILGVLGAASLIIAKRPDAKHLIDKLVPYQGWFGAVSVPWGIWTIISAVLGMGLIAAGPVLLVWWIFWLVSGLLLVALGLLLGVGVMKSFIKDDSAKSKMDQTVLKLAPFQGTLGIISIGVGIAYTVLTVIH